MMPSSGNRASGISAVANSGIAEVIHQIAINAATAASRLAGALAASTGNTMRMANAAMPSHSPQTWLPTWAAPLAGRSDTEPSA